MDALSHSSVSTGSYFLTEDEISVIWDRYDVAQSGGGRGHVPKEVLPALIDDCLFLTANGVQQHTKHEVKLYPPTGSGVGGDEEVGRMAAHVESLAAELVLNEDMVNMQAETKRLLLHLVKANKNGLVSKQEFMQRWTEYGERLFTAKTCCIL